MDNDDLGEMQKAFEITCKKCGHTGIQMEDSRDIDSEDTGPFGSMTIVCGNNTCDNEYDICSY